MALFYQDPFDALSQFQRALDQLRSSSWLAASPSGGGAYPPLNVFRKGDDIIIVAEVPGVAKADLRVEVKGNTLRIAGSRTVGPGGQASSHRRERRGGRFDRTIELPIAIDSEGVKAEYRDGILALHLPRAEHDKPRPIPVA
ncbi:MAG: Hsp20/alpha crystallin family protein [Reyranella sp.]|uniref:Hsp20/alpha crystallin family protein n=1 Tax=Reyranella sp. TaxID=1929291 RepID=UPI003D104658